MLSTILDSPVVLIVYRLVMSCPDLPYPTQVFQRTLTSAQPPRSSWRCPRVRPDCYFWPACMHAYTAKLQSSRGLHVGSYYCIRHQQVAVL